MCPGFHMFCERVRFNHLVSDVVLVIPKSCFGVPALANVAIVAVCAGDFVDGTRKLLFLFLVVNSHHLVPQLARKDVSDGLIVSAQKTCRFRCFGTMASCGWGALQCLAEGVAVARGSLCCHEELAPYLTPWYHVCACFSRRYKRQQGD